MEIDFKDKIIQKLCNEQRKAEKSLGQLVAKKLRTRLSDLEAAANVMSLVAGKPHPLKRARHGQFALRLAGGSRLVFKPKHDPVPHLNDGGIDWSKVTSVTIIFIGDYHE